MAEPPSIVVMAGPNGAGKSTAAPFLLHGAMNVPTYVNADVIAQGLAAFAPETVAFAAGRIMLERLHELAAARASFAFETTLASKTFAPWLRGLAESGYRCHIIFLWLPSPELAISRVAKRVGDGGHFVEDGIVRRRYIAGLRNFLERYRPLATTWRLYDNSVRGALRLVADGAWPAEHVHDDVRWAEVLESADDR